MKENNNILNMYNNVLDKPELYNLRVLYFINIFLILTDYLMPQYFGIHIGWDITCTRFANILLIIYGLCNSKMITMFSHTVLRFAFTWPLLVYLLVAAYTMVFRADVNALMLVFLEILTLYMLIFGIRYVIGCRRAVKITVFCSYFLGIYGLIEYVAGHSLYLQFLKTVPASVVNCYRSGHYRIMGPCGHPLGYGLLLLLFVAMACYDIEQDEVNLFQRPVLLVLLLLNVFLTGSRSTLGIAAVELLAIFFFCNRTNKKKALIGILALVAGCVVFLLLTFKTSIGQYVLMQVTSMIDQVFGTEYSAYFGADITTLKNSEEYREYLPMIFSLDWLNPIVGRGVKRSFGAEFPRVDGGMIYIRSIDNYYVSQYIKYAYPGLISYSAFIAVVLIMMIKAISRYKSGIFKVIFIATCCYFYNLWWLDALQTLKFMYIFIAIFCAYLMIFMKYEVSEQNGI